MANAVLERMKQVHIAEKEIYEATHCVAYNTADPTQNVVQIVTPDARAYSAVIQAHVTSNAFQSATKAYALLTEMMESGQEILRPDAIAVTNTMNAFANIASKSSGKTQERVLAKHRAGAAESAEALLMVLEDLAKRRSKQGNLVH